MYYLCGKNEATMRTTKKARLNPTEEEKQILLEISRSKTKPVREVERSTILLKFMENKSITDIAKECHTNRPLVERCINKAIAFGAMASLKDLPGRGKKPVITDEAKSWVLSVACQTPVSLGYAHELWTYSLLIKHIREHCHKAGHACLENISKGVLNKILSKGKQTP